MQTLQDLYDYYKGTDPTKGKLTAATNVLIHICKSMQVANAEEISRDQYAEIVEAIDAYYPHSADKAIQDKSILAEMIGRYGPRDGWEEPFGILLESKDSNLRQYVFQALDYIGKSEPALVLPYIERFKSSADLLMRHVASILVAKLFCAGQADFFKPVLRNWLEQGGRIFINEVAMQLKSAPTHFDPETCSAFKNWLQEELGIQLS